ncbi:MAG: hypothetical protein ACTS73_00225 [Arsenophonus sp. NEOnobi-MAG3]
MPFSNNKNNIPKQGEMYNNITNIKLTPGNELTASRGNPNHHRFSVNRWLTGQIAIAAIFTVY